MNNKEPKYYWFLVIYKSEKYIAEVFHSFSRKYISIDFLESERKAWEENYKHRFYVESVSYLGKATKKDMLGEEEC